MPAKSRAAPPRNLQPLGMIRVLFSKQACLTVHYVCSAYDGHTDRPKHLDLCLLVLLLVKQACVGASMARPLQVVSHDRVHRLPLHPWIVSCASPIL